jgi:peptidoglycan/xylan/chitin deacetylase (PgdA/CDA1 family)
LPEAAPKPSLRLPATASKTTERAGIESKATKGAGIERTPEPLTAEAEQARDRKVRRIAARLYQTQRGVRSRWFNGGRVRDKRVALTFDDGPDPKYTPRILDILRKEGVPATFFVLGSKVKQHPDLIRRQLLEGHELGNHTYHHYSLPGLDKQSIRDEIERTNEELSKVTGETTRWFRAPGCAYAPEVIDVLRELGMVRIDTTDNSGDWQRPDSRTILRKTMHHLSPGDVILCHDRLAETVQALPKIIEGLRTRGYRIVPLSTLALLAQSDRSFQASEWEWPLREGVRLFSAKRGVNASLASEAGRARKVPRSASWSTAPASEAPPPRDALPRRRVKAAASRAFH